MRGLLFSCFVHVPLTRAAPMWRRALPRFVGTPRVFCGESPASSKAASFEKRNPKGCAPTQLGKRQGLAASAVVAAAASETTRYSYDLPFALNLILSLSRVNSMWVLMGVNALSESFGCPMW